MRKMKQLGLQFLILLVMGCTHSLAQNNHEHSQGSTMQDLDAHLEHISQSENTDLSTRKRMLSHHMQMMREQLQSMQSMGHGGMMGGMSGGGMMGGMSQGDTDTGSMGGGMGQAAAGMCGGGGMCGSMMGGMSGPMNQDQDNSGSTMGEPPHEDRGDCTMCHGGSNGNMNQGNAESGMARGGMMGGMGGMMQHHNDMVKMLEHLLATQEMLLQLIEE